MPDGHLVSADGLKLSYRTVGSGRPVVLLHALTANKDVNWQQPGIVDALTGRGWQAVILDARGHGESERPTDPSAYVWERHGRDVVALLDELGLDACVLVGYSLGAGTAAWVTPREPRVRAAVLAGLAPESIAQWPADVADIYAAQVEASDPPFDSSNEVTVACVRALQQPAEFRLSDIAVPVLVLNGEDDHSPAGIASMIPGAVSQTVPGNHLTTPLYPEFTAALLEFLGSVSFD